MHHNSAEMLYAKAFETGLQTRSVGMSNNMKNNALIKLDESNVPGVSLNNDPESCVFKELRRWRGYHRVTKGGKRCINPQGVEFASVKPPCRSKNTNDEMEMMQTLFEYDNQWFFKNE